MGRFFCWTMMLMALLMFAVTFVQVAFSQFDDLPRDKVQINIGVSGVNDDSSISALIVTPASTGIYSGWLGLFGEQQTIEGIIESQVINAHIQGGFNIRGFGIECFYDFERNDHKGIAGQSQIGAFIRPGIYQVQGVEISGGVGNFLENTSAREDLGLKVGDPNVIRWLGYMSSEFRNVALLTRVTPEIDLSDFQVSIEPTVNFDLDERISLVLGGTAEYESASLLDLWHFSYRLMLGVEF